jgi:CheY-like chemotaxis protein
VHQSRRGAANARLRFEVHDSGIGIEPCKLDAIFQPFEQADNVQRRFGGTGLGLAISRQLVALMGGDIRVESRIGRGSHFSFELELALVAGHQGAQPVAPRAARSVIGYAGARRKLLVIDDTEANRRPMVMFLKSLGFELFEASDGAAGLERALDIRPDLILMDSVMPVMDGFETTRRIRELPTLRDVRVIAISASASAADHQHTLDVGADAFLSKPFTLSALVDEIGKLLHLQWDIAAQAGDGDKAALAEAASLPARADLEDLLRLAQVGNMQDLATRAGQVAAACEPCRPFALRLQALAEQFQSKAALQMVRSALDKAA